MCLLVVPGASSQVPFGLSNMPVKSSNVLFRPFHLTSRPPAPHVTLSHLKSPPYLAGHPSCHKIVPVISQFTPARPSQISFKLSQMPLWSFQISFRLSQMPPRSSQMPSRPFQMSYRPSQKPFRPSKMPFRQSQMPFRSSQIPSRPSQMPSRPLGCLPGHFRCLQGHFRYLPSRPTQMPFGSS